MAGGALIDGLLGGRGQTAHDFALFGRQFAPCVQARAAARASVRA
jgi:hypothetical protein